MYNLGMEIGNTLIVFILLLIIISLIVGILLLFFEIKHLKSCIKESLETILNLRHRAETAERKLVKFNQYTDIKDSNKIINLDTRKEG